MGRLSCRPRPVASQHVAAPFSAILTQAAHGGAIFAQVVAHAATLAAGVLSIV